MFWLSVSRIITSSVFPARNLIYPPIAFLFYDHLITSGKIVPRQCTWAVWSRLFRQWDWVSMEATENTEHVLVLSRPLLCVLREHCGHSSGIYFTAPRWSVSRLIAVTHLLIRFHRGLKFWSLNINFPKNFILSSCRQYATFRQLMLVLNQALVCSEWSFQNNLNHPKS